MLRFLIWTKVKTRKRMKWTQIREARFVFIVGKRWDHVILSCYGEFFEKIREISKNSGKYVGKFRKILKIWEKHYGKFGKIF